MRPGPGYQGLSPLAIAAGQGRVAFAGHLTGRGAPPNWPSAPESRREVGSMQLPTRPVLPGGRKIGPATGRAQLSLPAPHPKREVAGSGTGLELGQLIFELRHFGLERLYHCGLGFELLDLTAQSGHIRW